MFQLCREWSLSSVDCFMYILQGRRLSGPIPQKATSQIVLPRRCSVQGDGPLNLSASMNNQNFLASQSRFHCIQKSALRNVRFVPPPANVDSSSSLPLPRPSVVQRSDMMQSMESIDGMQPTLETPRYKTELCRPFEETGQCRYGGKCQFAHGKGELRSLSRHPKYKTELCKTFHTSGLCSYGQRCNFIHNDEERRGPSATGSSSVSLPRPSALHMSVPISPRNTCSESSSISSESPSQSPSYLHEDTFARLSPAPSFGSDGNSLASTYSPPGSPKHELFPDFPLSSHLDLGFSLTQLMKLGVQ